MYHCVALVKTLPCVFHIGTSLQKGTQRYIPTQSAPYSFIWWHGRAGIAYENQPSGNQWRAGWLTLPVGKKRLEKACTHPPWQWRACQVRGKRVQKGANNRMKDQGGRGSLWGGVTDRGPGTANRIAGIPGSPCVRTGSGESEQHLKLIFADLGNAPGQPKVRGGLVLEVAR